MARTFFDQVLVTEAPQRGSKWMKAASLVMHIVVLFVLLVLPITAAIDLPGVYTSLPPVILATASKLPPPPATPKVPSSTPVVAQTVPLEAPEGVKPEIEQPPSTPSTAGVPGGISVGSTLPATAYINNSTISIGPPPEPEKPRRVGGDIRAPERTFYKAPQYTAAAQAARIEGMVILEAVIDAQGFVQDVRVLRSVPMLDRAAIEAVQQWRYTPTRLNGIAIPIVMTVTVTFTLR